MLFFNVRCAALARESTRLRSRIDKSNSSAASLTLPRSQPTARPASRFCRWPILAAPYPSWVLPSGGLRTGLTGSAPEPARARIRSRRASRRLCGQHTCHARPPAAVRHHPPNTSPDIRPVRPATCRPRRCHRSHFVDRAASDRIGQCHFIAASVPAGHVGAVLLAGSCASASRRGQTSTPSGSRPSDHARPVRPPDPQSEVAGAAAVRLAGIVHAHCHGSSSG